MNPNRRSQRPSCSLPLPPVIFLGSLLSATFFGLVLSGPLDFAILRRYCLSHPVAIASVCLFFVGLVGLGLKWWATRIQSRLTTKSAKTLRRLITESQTIAVNKRAGWLAASLDAQPKHDRDSWFGQRVNRVLALQLSRGRRGQLEADLKALAEADADRQHDSYSLLRIINWAMPMLGFLGTVLGISQTLGQLDTKLLATQQQDAMNQLTAGLYVAFDTTAIALILTVFSMFVQFAVSRLEQAILSDIDVESSDCLIPYLAADPYDAQETLLSPVREMIQELIVGVRQLVDEQATVWSQAISETNAHWSHWSSDVAGEIESRLQHSLSQPLEKHVAELGKLQDEGNRQLDLRWQQWQTTLSDQARLLQGQQKEMLKQGDTLYKLVESTTDLRKLEETIGDSVARLENVERIERAAECVGEAVAVLATCLERAGVIRGAPIRPRAVGKGAESKHETNFQASSNDQAAAADQADADQTPAALPIEAEQRKAA